MTARAPWAILVRMTKLSRAFEEMTAAACHEVNRAWCIAQGDLSQVHWADAPQWQKDSAIAGVRGVTDSTTPEQSHESWAAVKRADGWVYGKVKDADAKTHPCLVPYAELPEEQRAKDGLFNETVRQMVAIRRAHESI